MFVPPLMDHHYNHPVNPGIVFAFCEQFILLQWILWVFGSKRKTSPEAEKRRVAKRQTAMDHVLKERPRRS